MVVNLAVLVLIPVVLAVVTVSPFADEQPDQNTASQEAPNFSIMFFTLMIIWVLIMMRTLYVVRRGGKIHKY